MVVEARDELAVGDDTGVNPGTPIATAPESRGSTYGPGRTVGSSAATSSTPLPAPTATPRRSLRRRIRARTIDLGAGVVGRLPESPLIVLAEATGEAWYRAAPKRAAQARLNLRRVCVSLAAQGRGSDRVRAAATDPAALERLVRSAFRHAARYYLEVARAPRMDAAYIRDRLFVETPGAVADAFESGDPTIFVGMHFGAIELPTMLLVQASGRTATAPMETIDDPDLQAWFRRTRGASGIRIVGLREARRELTNALRRGDPVGLVGDRDLTGGGIDVPLFGAPAPLPARPGLLAIETGARIYVMAVRRTGRGRYRGRVELVPVPTEGSRRQRLTEFLAGEAQAFERAIADAPDQWWAVFFPIWPDLVP